MHVSRQKKRNDIFMFSCCRLWAQQSFTEMLKHGPHDWRLGLWWYKSLLLPPLNFLNTALRSAHIENRVDCWHVPAPSLFSKSPIWASHESRGRTQKTTFARTMRSSSEIPNSYIYATASYPKHLIRSASIKTGLVIYHVLLSRCLRKRGKQAMREAELGKSPILPEEYKSPPLLLPSLKPAFSTSKPKVLQRLLMFAAAPLPKTEYILSMRSGNVCTSQWTKLEKSPDLLQRTGMRWVSWEFAAPRKTREGWKHATGAHCSVWRHWT